MKIGVSTSIQNAILIKNHIDYVELNLSELTKLSDAEFSETEKLLKQHHISAEVSNCFFTAEQKLCGKDFDEEAILSYAERALERAARLGIQICVLGSGAARRIPEGEDAMVCQRQWERLLCSLGDCAARYGIDIAIEPLNRAETNVVNTVTEGAELVRRLDHPQIHLLADFFHMAEENESWEAILAHADMLRHVHIASPQSRTFPVAEDNYNYNAFSAACKAANQNARVSIEAVCQGEFVETATKSLVFLKQIFQ